MFINAYYCTDNLLKIAFVKTFNRYQLTFQMTRNCSPRCFLQDAPSSNGRDNNVCLSVLILQDAYHTSANVNGGAGQLKGSRILT